jgi:hypothetical protein
MVDGQDQSILMGTRHVYRAAQATLHEWVSNAVFDFVSGSHDGYCRLADPVTHWRSILFVKPEYWIVFDLLAGHGVHTLEQYFHLAPGAVPRADHRTGSVYVDQHGSPAITLAPMDAASLRVDVVSGATDPVQGWVSFYSGEKLAAPVVTYQQTVQLPALFGTVLYPHPPGSACAVQAHNLPVRVDGGSANPMMISGVTVETPDYVDMCVVSHGDAPAWKIFAGVESDARIIYLRRRNSDGAVVRTATEPTTATLRVH